MSLNTGNAFNNITKRDASDEGPNGAGTLMTESTGEPSTDTAPPKQSPSWTEKDFTVTPATSDSTGYAKTQSGGPLAGINGHQNVILTADGSK